MNYLELASRFAKGGDPNRNFWVGCVAKRKDGAIVASCNEKTKEPVPKAHAESRCLRKAGWGSTLWVARILKSGEWGLAKPCTNCQNMIRHMGVKRVYYTIGPGEYGVWDVKKSKKP